MRRYQLIYVVLFALLTGILINACSDQAARTINSPAVSAGTLAKTVQRPISDFVSAQGITNYFVPPVSDFMGWYKTGDDRSLLASVDYAGVSDRYLNGSLGTTFSGSVSERQLPDGRAEVSVNLHTRNTLMYILDAQNWDFATDPLLFGNRAHDVKNGAAPARGDAHFEVVFINTAPGAPLPDFMWALYGYWVPTFPLLPLKYPWPGFELVSMRINASADGPLHAASGLGPYGTPGHGRVVQVNLRSQAQHHGAHGDQWPVENIDYHRRP